MQRAERSAHALANQGVGRLVAIFRDGARVVVACWPQLLVIFLIGAAIRNATLWLAVKATLVHAFLGQAIMPIAPLATLVALVLMLRIADRELLRSASSDVPDSPQPVFTRSAVRRWSNDLLLATSVLVPFLAVYASYGLLQEDRVGYLHDVATDATASGV